MTTFQVSPPVHVRNSKGERIPGHYEAEVWIGDEPHMRRYLTDKGRAEVLRLLDRGRTGISEKQLHEYTVAPSLDALLIRMDQEAGEGG